MPESRPPEECANCGATIPPGAKACPECGADERTGWRETSIYDGIDLPENLDDSPSTERKRASHQRRVNGLAWYWWVVSVALIVAALIGGMRLR